MTSHVYRTVVIDETETSKDIEITYSVIPLGKEFYNENKIEIEGIEPPIISKDMAISLIREMEFEQI